MTRDADGGDAGAGAGGGTRGASSSGISSSNNSNKQGTKRRQQHAEEGAAQHRRPAGLGSKRAQRATSASSARVERILQLAQTRHTGSGNSSSNRDDDDDDELAATLAVLSASQRASLAAGTGVRVTRDAQPYEHFVMDDVFDEAFIDRLEAELKSLEFTRKSNDLYKFAQSDDLKGVDAASKPCIAHLRRVLFSRDFLEHVERVTGIALNTTIDMSCFMYEQTDTLLCHDDELEGRRIAYILYLVPSSWRAEDGGTLDLFDVDEARRPQRVVKRLVPRRNTLAFFPVSDRSYHQVAEVLSPSDVRLTVTGWFHGEPFARPPEPTDVPAYAFSDVHVPASLDALSAEQRAELAHWVNPRYLAAGTQASVRKAFARDSAVTLPDFLADERIEQVLKALEAAPESAYELVGPANRRHFWRLALRGPDVDSDAGLAALKRMQSFLVSNTMCCLLAALTGVDIARAAGLVRRLSHGCYTLLQDKKAATVEDETAAFALDATLFFSPIWGEDWGGQTVYIAEGETEELLSVFPDANNLSLVYRTGTAMRFVKHVNCVAGIPRYDADMVYVCNDADDDHSTGDEEDEDDEDDEADDAEEGNGGGDAGDDDDDDNDDAGDDGR